MPFVPDDFEVPLGFETDRYRLEPLTVRHVVQDYDAVMTSVDHLRRVFGPTSTWPQPDMSLEQNLIDLGFHQKLAQRRQAFVYAVMSLDGDRELGCVYIDPPQREDYDAGVVLWVRASHATDLDEDLYREVRSWIAGDWPFDNVAYPGRDMHWVDWRAG